MRSSGSEEVRSTSYNRFRRFGTISGTRSVGSDKVGRFVHNRPRPGRSSEKESGWCSTSAGSLAVSLMKINHLPDRWDAGEAQRTGNPNPVLDHTRLMNLEGQQTLLSPSRSPP